MLHIEASGQGPRAVVLLHGAPTPAEVLAPLVEVPLVGLRRLVVHLPGYGRSTPNPRGAGIAETHRRLLAALAAAGVSDCALVGFSAGAYHALALASSGRLRPRVLVSLAGFATLSAEERNQYVQFATVLRSGADLHALMPARLLSPGARAGRPELAAEVARWLDAVPTELLADELDSLARCEDLSSRLATLPCPVICRAGDADVATPLHHAMRIVRSCADARLELVPGAGHALPLEDLEGTRASIVRALASVWS
jgi:pimeloyl-ACP methyl ester carboxylesterase